MYRLMMATNPFTGEPVEQILRELSNGDVQSFPNTESNTGPERAAYLAWVAEGNTPEVIEP
jgi:hypothetical protein